MMAKTKPYKAKSISGAERKVRRLQKTVAEYEAIIDRFKHEQMMLAKLAATGPAFMNPFNVIAAEKLRDDLLRREGMNPDGKFR